VISIPTTCDKLSSVDYKTEKLFDFTPEKKMRYSIVLSITIVLIIVATIAQCKRTSPFSIPTEIIATTYEMESKNNSILHVDTSNGNLTDRMQIDNVFQFSTSTIDVRNRKLYCLGDQTIWSFNADSFLPLIVLAVGNPTDIQYDWVQQKMYGLEMPSEISQIVEIDMKTGQATPIIKFNNPDGVFEGGFTYDQKGHRYFISSQDDLQNYYIMAFDTVAKKVLNRINTTAFLEELQYDPLKDRLIGMNGGILSSVENIGVGQTPVTKALLDLKGLSNLNGAAIDYINNVYIVNILNEYPKTGSRWVAVDLATTKIIYDKEFYANCANVHLLPVVKKN
jgi:hypothetical protein